MTATAGMAALFDERQKFGQLALISRSLSVKQQEAAAGVARLGQELEAEKNRASVLEMRLSELIAEHTHCGVVFEPSLSLAARKHTAQALARRLDGIGAVLSGSDDAGYDYVIALPEGRAACAHLHSSSVRSAAEEVEARSLSAAG